MAFVPHCKIRIGKYTFTGVNDISIARSIYSLAHTCTLKLPASAVMKNSTSGSTAISTADLIRKGDEVSVELNYENYPVIKSFKGFVTSINHAQPLVIECENEAFLLKKKNIHQTFYRINAVDLITRILQGTGIKLSPETKKDNLKLTIDQMQVDNQTAAWVLQELKDKYAVHSYFTAEGELYAGLEHGQKGTKVKYDLHKNVIKTENLKWQKPEDIKILVKTVCHKSDGSTVEAEYGDEDGEVKTIAVYDVTDQKQLLAIAKTEHAKYHQAGFKGDIETLLHPEISHADIAVIRDSVYPERSGDYFVHTVTTTFGTGGCRQKVEIDLKLTA